MSKKSAKSLKEKRADKRDKDAPSSGIEIVTNNRKR